MGDWFLGEIRAFPMSWAPDGWALCNGAQLQIQQNAALYALLGTTFGGNGSTTFNLPDLRGRTLTGTSLSDPAYQRGMAGGTETVSLLTSQIPPHNHSINMISQPGTFPVPTGNFLSSAGTSAAVPTAPNLFATPTTTSSMIPLNPLTLSNTGAGTGHNNMQPSLVVNYCIAILGLFPPRN